jgi:hypothetical protein
VATKVAADFTSRDSSIAVSQGGGACSNGLAALSVVTAGGALLRSSHGEGEDRGDSDEERGLHFEFLFGDLIKNLKS